MHTLMFLAASATPDPQIPTLRPGLSDDQVGPGFLGFLAMAFIVAIMFFLIRDMVKRVRRVRYRAQVAGGDPSDHGPKAGYEVIPIMTDDAARKAGAAFADTSLTRAEVAAVGPEGVEGAGSAEGAGNPGAGNPGAEGAEGLDGGVSPVNVDKN
ncbi:hypothetical protein [Arthrobacter sp. A2-55]|uniref:hypothetical protein n=1 Tax=Arthrobacter sp. A2-55 TaxID=2897337 RepID=UPI0021CD2BF6|nr:hypothetical protein [Arthrobacter sp. A2-55]MCU6482439.1 hypothetical protein [Arthrobacter sp. A2-55]